jgi:hypothetical protein
MLTTEAFLEPCGRKPRQDQSWSADRDGCKESLGARVLMSCHQGVAHGLFLCSCFFVGFSGLFMGFPIGRQVSMAWHHSSPRQDQSC